MSRRTDMGSVAWRARAGRLPRHRSARRGPSARAARAGAAAAYGTPIQYESEGQAAYESQLKNREIQSAAFNYVAHHLHLTLKDGRHVYYSYYPAYEPAQVEAQLKAHGIPIVAQHHAPTKPCTTRCGTCSPGSWSCWSWWCWRSCCSGAAARASGGLVAIGRGRPAGSGTAPVRRVSLRRRRPQTYRPRPRGPCGRGRRRDGPPRAARRGARADPRLHGRGDPRGHPRRIAGAALRRRSHAHRRGRTGARAARR